MSGSTASKSRYPGVGAFEEKQHELFFGRKTETKELIQLLKAERTIILFAKSGVGKSSLLNAGLIPHMYEEGFYPIKVRFQYTGDKVDNDTPHKTPLRIVEEVIHQKIALPTGPGLKEGEVLFDSNQPRLWERFKTLEFPSYVPKSTGREQLLQSFRQRQSAIEGIPVQSVAADIPQKMVPVVIFDQFEEFFNFSPGERHNFLTQLSELLHEMCPNRVLEWLRNQPPESRTSDMVEWSKQPLIKCIFAIRDDKLAELDALNKYIPLVLRNRYRLFPLDYDNAKEAMTEPAKVDGDFESPAFTFNDHLLKAILGKLCGNTLAPPLLMGQLAPGNGQPVTGGVDGSQLQKICSYIEHKVIDKAKDKPGIPVIVDETLIKQSEAEKIIDEFYEDQLMKIGNQKDIDFCREIIELHLVARGKRASLTEGQMENLLKDRKDLLKKMMDARLVREEYTHLGRTYELSHDTLVKAVAKHADRHRELLLKKDKDRQARYKILFLVLAVIAGICMLRVLYMSSKIERDLNKTKGWLAAKYYNDNNHYLAFRLWESYRRVGLFDTKARDSAINLLNTRFFFDISGGLEINILKPDMYLVREAENRVDLWTLPQRGKRLSLTTLTDVTSLEISDTHGYFIYRDKAGNLMIYDVNRRSRFSIPHAKLDVRNAVDNKSGLESAADLDADYEVDYKAGFLPGSDFIWYITEQGETYLFDLEKAKRINYSFTSKQQAAERANTDAGAVIYRMKLSPDKKLLAVFNSGLLRIYNIAGGGTPVLTDTITGITWMDTGAYKDWLVYGTQATIYVSSYLNGWRHADSKPIPYLFRQAVSDNTRLVYSSKAGQLTLYNLLTQSIDTTIADYARRSSSSLSTITKSLDRPRSFSISNGILKYHNRQNKMVYYSLASRSYLPELRGSIIFSAKARFYAYVDSLNQLSVYDVGKRTKVFQDKSVEYDFIGGFFCFNESETRLAYLKDNGQGKMSLEVVGLPAGNKIRSHIVDAKFSLLAIPRDSVVNVEDQEGNKGMIFLNNEKRGYDYFTDRYPLLSPTEKVRVGIE